MEVKLSEHFDYKKIFRISLSPILMMIFTSVYGVVDGLFIANFAGEASYAGINLIMPVIMVIGGIGFMFGTGGSALSAKLLGEGKDEEANRVFSMMFIFTLISGAVISLLGYFLIKPIAVIMGNINAGSSETMVSEAITYGRVLIVAQVGFMLQNLFQSYFMVAEKPRLGFIFTVAAGVTNIIFDALFIAVFRWGVRGAALATILGYLVGSIGPVIYFAKAGNCNLMLVKTRLEIAPIARSCANGSSEFVNNISSSIVSIVYNIQLLKFIGDMGISAFGTIMYVSFIFVAIFVGYSIGMAPVIGYNYGAQNREELHNVLKKSFIILLSMSFVMAALGYFGSPILAKLFSSGNEALAELSETSLKIYALSYLLSGFCIFMSSFFTALNNGFISALISFIRTIVFAIAFVFIFPAIFGQNGIWWAMVGAEAAALIVSLICLKLNQKKYGY